MGYEYYCDNCGRRIDESNVLFDMRRILLQTSKNEDVFSVIPFYMTEQEIWNFFNKGVNEQTGFRCCKLSFQEFVNTIANENNMGREAIRGLTMADISRYITTSAEAVSKPKRSLGTLFFDDYDEAENDEPEEVYVEPPAIMAIKSAYKENKDSDVFGAAAIRSDFLKVLMVFNDSDEIQIRCNPLIQKDDKKNDVLIGFEVMYPSGAQAGVSARVCYNCKERVFEHAGEAKHQSIVLIGDPASGKTSTILSLAHYAQNFMTLGLEREIWGNSRMADDLIRDIELVSVKQRLREDIMLYQQGIAPNRTKATSRKDAYDMTLWVTDKFGRHHLVTIIDLPGEICFTDDHTVIDEEKLQGEFRVALSCDAFIVCFDGGREERDLEDGIVSGDAAGARVRRVCNQVERFQQLRARIKKQEIRAQGKPVDDNMALQAPVILLYTKCKELEEQKGDNHIFVDGRSATREGERYHMNLYSLLDEEKAISENAFYRAIITQMGNCGLNKGYYATLRCSPYGYHAPSLDDVSSTENPKKAQTPSPRNVDRLMIWLMQAAGCSSVDGEFIPGLAERTGYPMKNYYFSRQQYRDERPERDSGDEYSAMKEAIARYILFINPSDQDFAELSYYAQYHRPRCSESDDSLMERIKRMWAKLMGNE